MTNVWNSIPATRTDIRAMLRIVRDGCGFDPVLRARLVKAISRITDADLTEDRLPARAAEILENRYAVRRLVDLWAASTPPAASESTQGRVDTLERLRGGE